MVSDVWKSYWPILERLERELCEITFAVAFADSHLGVYSARFADLLLRSCAECENVGKSLCVEKRLSSSGANIQQFNFPAIGNAICSRIAIHTKDLHALVFEHRAGLLHRRSEHSLDSHRTRADIEAIADVPSRCGDDCRNRPKL